MNEMQRKQGRAPSKRVMRPLMATLVRIKPGEREWIKEYFKKGKNVTEATRIIYGGSPLSCKIRGNNKVKRLKTILKEIEDRNLNNMECQGISGIDFYLGNLERENKQQTRIRRGYGKQQATIRLEYETVEKGGLVKEIIRFVETDCGKCGTFKQLYTIHFRDESHSIKSCPLIQELINKKFNDLWLIHESSTI